MEVTKTISWHMAHRILGYEGLCGTIHGHTYSAELTLKGSVQASSGMVCDFKVIKTCLSELVDAYFDHALLLEAGDPMVALLQTEVRRLVLLNARATVENIAQVIFNLLDIRIRSLAQAGSLGLLSLRVWETPTSSVSVYEEDSSVQVVFWTNSGEIYCP